MVRNVPQFLALAPFVGSEQINGFYMTNDITITLVAKATVLLVFTPK